MIFDFYRTHPLRGLLTNTLILHTREMILNTNASEVDTILIRLYWIRIIFFK